MTEGANRLEKLRFTRRVVEQQTAAALAQLDRWIAQEEEREADRRRAEERRPPPSDWLFERGPGGGAPVTVHRSDCWAPGRLYAPATRAQAVEALARQVPACQVCRPDTALGLLD
ncbi:DUF6233 domain-containing protein [Streptomyces sp. NPDC090306]|uniref:DUF6233 domain-containing protein n=1 Tax=unclassified Streptomyces TaxID=2593676 RepID=UPI0036E56086